MVYKAKDRVSGMIIALKRIRLEAEDEGVQIFFVYLYFILFSYQRYFVTSIVYYRYLQQPFVRYLY